MARVLAIMVVGLTGCLLVGCGHAAAGHPIPSRLRGTLEWLEGCWGAGSVDWFARERWAWRSGRLEGYTAAWGMGPSWEDRLRIEPDSDGDVVLVVEHVSGWSPYPAGRHRFVSATQRELRFSSGDGTLVLRRDFHSGGEWLAVGDQAGLSRASCETAE